MAIGTVQIIDQSSELRPWSFKNMFVDMLHLRADNTNNRWPIVNDGYVVYYDQHENEVFTKERSMPIVGSYNTKAFLQVDHEKLELHFNPSRYQRSENLFGVSYEEAIRIVNSILEEKDLKQLEGFNLTRVDLTNNLVTGNKNNLREYLVQLRRKKLSRMQTIYRWDSALFKNTRKSITVYDKGAEMQEHALKDAKKWSKTISQNDVYREVQHVERWKNYCDQVGLARLELRLGRHYLRDNNLRDGTLVTMESLKEAFMKETAEIITEVEEFEAEDLKLKKHHMATYLLWREGRNPRDHMSKNTYYQHRDYLRKHIGIDIAIHPQQDAEFQRRRRAFTVQEAELPEGYILPFRRQSEE